MKKTIHRLLLYEFSVMEYEGSNIYIITYKICLNLTSVITLQ